MAEPLDPKEVVSMEELAPSRKKSIKERFKKLDKSTIGILVTILGIIFALLFAYYFARERKPNISFEITNETNVLDVYKPLKDLTIAFQGDDIQRQNLNLRIFTIRIENSGGVNILEIHYASDDIWGFQVRDGKIIEVRLIDSNDDSIKEKLNPQLVKEDKEDIVQFKKIIFDRKAFFTLEVLVLHPKKKLPELIPCGKIAGIDRIVVTTPWAEKGKKNFLAELLHGSVLIHIVRLFSYLIILVIIGIVVVLTLDKISSLRQKRKEESRRKEAVNVLGIEASTEGSKSKIITDNYVYGGLETLRQLQALLEDQEKLDKKMKKYEKANEINKHLLEYKAIDSESKDVVDVPNWYGGGMLREFGYEFYEDQKRVDFVEEGILSVGEDSRVIVDSEFKAALDKLIVTLAAQEKQKGSK